MANDSSTTSILADRCFHLPKVDLHFHMAGTLRPETLVRLARKYDLPLPRPTETLYSYQDFYEFIDVLRIVAQAVRTRDDFELVAYEAIEDAVRTSHARHVEMSFNPQYFMPTGVPYRVQVEGLTAGLLAARRDFGCSGLLIASIDRGLPLDSAEQAMQDIIGQRSDLVVGVGLDGPERAGPPAQFAHLFQRAGRAGFKRTAHVCEDNQTITEAPPSNVAACLDHLGCDRLDHGYNLLASEHAVRRARDSGVYFCVCGVTSAVQRQRQRFEGIKRMVDAGLRVTLNTDDPAMFHTHLTHSYTAVLDASGWGWDQARAFSLAGLDACWLDDDAKRALRKDFEQEITLLEGPFAKTAH